MKNHRYRKKAVATDLRHGEQNKGADVYETDGGAALGSKFLSTLEEEYQRDVEIAPAKNFQKASPSG